MLRSPLLERVIRLSQLKWADGGLELFRMPVFLGAAHIDIYKNLLIELNFGYKEAMSILYEVGSFQGLEAFNIFSKMYGYSKKISDKSKMLDLQLSQSEVAGYGKFCWVKKDFKNNIFIIRGRSVLARIYRDKIGISKRAADHQLRGVSAKFVELVTGNKCLAVETRCMAKGDSFCEAVIKPIDKWDKNDPRVIEQTPSKIKSIPKFKIF